MDFNPVLPEMAPKVRFRAGGSQREGIGIPIASENIAPWF